MDGFHKKTEGTYSDEIYTVESVYGKTVVLTDGVKKKYDMLLKVSPDTISMVNPMKVAKKEYKRELLHKKTDVNENNIIRTKREIKKPEKLKF